MTAAGRLNTYNKTQNQGTREAHYSICLSPEPSYLLLVSTPVSIWGSLIGVACGSPLIPVLYEKAQAPGSGVQALCSSENFLYWSHMPL